MSYRPESIQVTLHHLQNLETDRNDSATWSVEMIFSDHHRSIPLNQGAVTDALFCATDQATMQFPYCIKGKIYFYLVRDNQPIARTHVKIDELTGTLKSRVKKTVNLKWEAPSSLPPPRLVMELQIVPEPPEDHCESVWGMSLHQTDCVTGNIATGANGLLFPRERQTVVGASIWTGMLNDPFVPAGVNGPPLGSPTSPLREMSSKRRTDSTKLVTADHLSPIRHGSSSRVSRHHSTSEEDFGGNSADMHSDHSKMMIHKNSKKHASRHQGTEESPYREHSASANSSFITEYVSSSRVGPAMESSAKLPTNGRSPSAAKDSEEKPSLRTRIFGGHLHHHRSEQKKLIESSQKNVVEVDVVVSQDLIKKFANHRL